MRALVDGSYREMSLGRADDAIKADGTTYLDFRQAEAKARAEVSNLHHRAAGLEAHDTARSPYTVGDAMAAYLRSYTRRGGKWGRHVENNINAHILPDLGILRLDRLTRSRIVNWRDSLIEAAPRRRTRAGGAPGRKRREMEVANPDAMRRRRATANRLVAILKAALNFAHQEGRIHSNAAWAMVKKYREVDLPRIRHLSDDESVRLVNACDPDLRDIVIAGMLTGLRYGEICRLRCLDFNTDVGIITVQTSKSGKARHVYLTDEGRRFFQQAVAGHQGSTLIFKRQDGEAWGQSHQFRPLREACASARIEPPISFHILRHTYASRLALAGTPLPVIAAQLGHAGTRMTERHYAHLTPNYVADTVRAAFGPLGIVKQSNVELLALAALKQG